MRVAIVALVLAACASADRPSRTDLPRAPKDHRANAPACASTRTSAEPVLSNVTTIGCTRNADCTAGRNGRCVVTETSSACVYDACVTNADCPGVAICECGETNRCVAEGCTIDRDCGHGGYCSPSACAKGDGVPHYCHTTDDECLDDEDCPGIGVCRYQASSRTWRCLPATCP
jgi:hypothetical protein